MAASGFTPLQLYYSTTATAEPLASNLVSGELSINITDGKLYYKDNIGAVKLLASASGVVGGGTGVIIGNGSSAPTYVAAGTTGNVLTSNGTTWISSAGSGGGGGLVAGGGMFENSKTISVTYTITSGSCAMSTGPITVTSGHTITIPSGSRWVIL